MQYHENLEYSTGPSPLLKENISSLLSLHQLIKERSKHNSLSTKCKAFL